MPMKILAHGGLIALRDTEQRLDARTERGRQAQEVRCAARRHRCSVGSFDNDRARGRWLRACGRKCTVSLPAGLDMTGYCTATGTFSFSSAVTALHFTGRYSTSRHAGSIALEAGEDWVCGRRPVGHGLALHRASPRTASRESPDGTETSADLGLLISSASRPAATGHRTLKNRTAAIGHRCLPKR